MTNPGYWGSTDAVFQCLIDGTRTNAFRAAIKNTVKKGDVVVDLGSGSGILSMFAVEAGASKVYAVEADENVAKVLALNIERNGYKDKIILVKADATTVVLPEKVDVAISEMVATGLIDELQIPVMNNIQTFLKKDAKIIPMIIQNYMQLVDINSMFYDHLIDTIQYEYEWDGRDRATPMTINYMYKEVNFNQKNDNVVSLKARLEILQNGQINGLRFSNMTFFPDKSKIEGTAAYCMPLIFPLEEQKVNKGDIFIIELNYLMCTGMDNFEFTLKKEPTNM
jgi:predicted RNA methylase